LLALPAGNSRMSDPALSGEKSDGMDCAAVSIGLKRFEVRMAHDKTSITVTRKVCELLNVETCPVAGFLNPVNPVEKCSV